jgi:hypothetical protein
MQESLALKDRWDDVTDLNAYYAHGNEFNEVRQSLEQGVEHSACATCWAYEREFSSSMRLHNMYYRDTQPVPIDIQHVDLRLSNRCNLQCRMCSPSDSDQLHKLALELESKGIDSPLKYILPRSYNSDASELLKRVVELPNLKAIRLAGGEPFVMQEVEEFIFKLVELGKTDIEIEFITNCTSAKSRVIEQLEKFKRVLFLCSIDGVGDALEYQRYPAKWKSIENNFITLYNSKCDTRLVPCIGILNYLQLPEFFEWSNKFLNTRVMYNEIQEPEFFNFRYVPERARQEFYQKFATMKLNNADHKWTKFQSSTMYETATPSEAEIVLLKEYIKVWDYKCSRTFIQQYEWAKEII